MTETPDPNQPTRTLSYRSVLIGFCGMMLVAIWVFLHKVYLGGSDADENSPPAMAVGIFLGILLVVGGVQLIKRKLGLARGELLVIYTMLVIAAPLYTQGMWQRFLGLLVAIPSNPDYFDLLDSYSSELWPHGEQLIVDDRFREGLTGPVSADNPQYISTTKIEESQIGATTGLMITHGPEAEGTVEDPTTTTVRIRVPRRRDGEEILVPGEAYFLTGLFKLENMLSRSSFDVRVVTDGGDEVDVLRMAKDTLDRFKSPGAFERRGEPFVSLPRRLTEEAFIELTLRGPGRVTMTDIQFFSNQALARMREGSKEIAAGQLEGVPENERDGLLVKPTETVSPHSIWYRLKGYIPYRMWLRPMLFWGSIVLAVFITTLALGVIFRKQWAENERFGFPLIVVPRLLLEQKDENGRLIRPLFKSMPFRIGVGAALVYGILIGLPHYVPGLPTPKIDVALGPLFSSPTMKAFVGGMYGGNNKFNVIFLFVAIAFFIDLQLLASFLIFFAVSMLPWGFAEYFGWNEAIEGPAGSKFPFPHSLHIGAFLALALVVLWVSRRHLVGVARRVFGMPGGVDDSGEAMRYRTAAFLLFASFLFFGAWGAMTGLGIGSALIFFGFIIVCGLVAARIRCEFGAPYAYFTPYLPYMIFYILGGLNVFTTETMVLAYLAGGFMAVAQFLMVAPTQVEMLELARQQKAKASGVKWAIVAGILGGVLIGGYVTLMWSYGGGSENLPYQWAFQQGWVFYGLDTAVADHTQALATEEGVEYKPAALVAVFIGALVTVGLTVLRTLFVGFWLHPIGFILANTHFAYFAWGSILVAFLIKLIALKVAGPRFIRQTLTPFFAGVFVGCVAAIALWDVVALILRAQGAISVGTIVP